MVNDERLMLSSQDQEQTNMSTLFTIVLTMAIRQENDVKGIHIGKEGGKHFISR